MHGELSHLCCFFRYPDRKLMPLRAVVLAVSAHLYFPASISEVPRQHYMLNVGSVIFSMGDNSNKRLLNRGWVSSWWFGALMCVSHFCTATATVCASLSELEAPYQISACQLTASDLENHKSLLAMFNFTPLKAMQISRVFNSERHYVFQVFFRVLWSYAGWNSIETENICKQ